MKRNAHYIGILVAVVIIGSGGMPSARASEENLSGTSTIMAEAPTSTPYVINSEGLARQEMRQSLTIREEACEEPVCNNGEDRIAIHVKGARIIKKTETHIVAAIWKQQYILEEASSTEYIRRTGEPSSREEVIVGDIVNFQGSITSEDLNRVTVTLLRNLSAQKRHVIKKGTLTRASSTPLWHTLQAGDGEYDILISTSTKIIEYGKMPTIITSLPETIMGMVRGTREKAFKKIKAEIVVITPAENKEGESDEFKKRIDEKLEAIKKKATEVFDQITP